MFRELFQRLKCSWTLLLLCWYREDSKEYGETLLHLRTKWFSCHCDTEWDRFGVSDSGFISWIFISWVRLELLGFIRCRGWVSDLGQTGSLFPWFVVSDRHFHLTLQLSSLCTCYSSLTSPLLRMSQKWSLIPSRKTREKGTRAQTLSVHRSHSRGSSSCCSSLGFTRKNHYFQGQFFKGNTEICYEIRANRC